MKTCTRTLLLFVLLLAALPAHAQDSTRSQGQTVAYGDTVDGMIDDINFEVFYHFEGTQGDIVVFELQATEDSSNLNSPEILMLDGDNRVLFDTARQYDFQKALLAATLPYTGSYQVIVTREDGRTGDDNGTYSLRVLQVPLLLPQETLNGTALNSQPVNYYAVQQPGAFTLYYEFSNGELQPYIEAYRLQNNGLMRVASLNGPELRSGSIGLAGTSTDVFIFTVGDTPFAISFDDEVERADYRLRLIVSE